MTQIINIYKKTIERVDTLYRKIQPVSAQDNKWITVKPNGEEHKGSHVEIDGDGRVVKGMGGKFKGEKIGTSEVDKEFRENSGIWRRNLVFGDDMDYLDETFAQDKRDIDKNGWFESKNNPLSKEGVFLYRGSQIRLPDGTQAPEPEKLYGVYRPAEELSDHEAIESFKLIPWTDGHTMLGSEDIGLTPAEKKGVSGIIGEEVYFRDGVLYGNIKAFSENLARKIEGGKKELSLGYRCEYEYSPGVWKGQKYDYIQRKLRGNHLALVENGRMGSDVRVMDGADVFVFACDSKMEEKMADINSLPGTGEESGGQLDDVVKLLQALVEKDGSPAPTTDDNDLPEDGEEFGADDGGEGGSEGGEKSPSDKLMAVLENITARLDKLEAAQKAPASDEDGEELGENDQAEKDGKKAEAMDAASITKQVMANIEAKTKLYAALSPVIGSFATDSMDVQNMAAYGCKKLNLDAPKGGEIAVLSGYLQAKKSGAAQSVAMDAAAKPKGPSFIDGQLSK